MQLPLSIKELHSDLTSKKYSVSEMVDFQLNRIKANDPKLNSFLTVTGESAKRDAKTADELIGKKGKDAFRLKPLLGVTVGYKDLYLTEGVRTTAGSKVLKNYIPQYSSVVYEKLNYAGTVMLGKNNCDAWAHGASGENSDFGPTKNPWNLEYVPGGSSSGPAVSVSSGFTHIAMGTDTGGSIRQPASFCNVVGLKPTYGAVSRYGVVAMASSLDTMGHFTQTVEDARTVYNLTSGVDDYDATLKKSDFRKNDKKYTIGIPKEYFIKGIDAEVVGIVEKAIEVLRSHKIEVKEVSLPHTKYAISVYYIVQPAEVSSNLGRYDGIRYGYDRNTFGDEAKRRIMLGTYVLSAGYYDAYYLKAQKVRSKLIEDFSKAFESVDAVIAPVSPTPPFKLGEKATDPLQMYLADVFTVAGNLVGIPGLAVPGGFTKAGLPVGFQLLGPRFSEELLFDIGEIYQSVTDWHTKKPKI